MNTRLWKVFAGMALLALASGVSAQGNPPPQNAMTMKRAPAATSGSYDKALLTPATLNAKAPETFDVKFVTSEGDFVIHVTRAWAPNGADRFYNLVKHHFLDGAAFFRVIPGFMAQFGLSAYPDVNKAWDTADIKDDPVKQSNTRGKITFAATGAPNSRSTQMFINFGNNGQLDSQRFAPFGEVTSGMEVVDKIYSGYGEQPDQDQIRTHGKDYWAAKFPKLDAIKSATIESAPAGATTMKPAAH